MLHRNTVVVRREPTVTISEKFTYFVACDFSTSSGCLKSGAFFGTTGEARVGVRHIVDINPE